MKRVIIKKKAFDVRMEYSKKAFGQKSKNYLVPKNYNSTPVNIKSTIFYTEGNHITIEMKKKIQIWLFLILE